MSRMLSGFADGGNATLPRRVKPPCDVNANKDSHDLANDSPEDEILNGLVKAATLQSETRDHRRKARQFNRKSCMFISKSITLQDINYFLVDHF
ncbi:hypothetical protein DICVIV_02541 [Dictyocaulus viviparus]|uniref:Uncharacterized protein n=1 Tax=Dictyocaulus viviparus TaxID=29172 RepID=A0A0D8Y512_DICVI|nr:hypothetical protein DICVIV_02541 [Dictyocaulus viviparus]